MSLPTRQKVKDLEDADYFKKQNAVVDDFLKGNTNYTDLARKHKINRAEAIQMMDEWKNFVKSDKSFKEMGRERLHEMDRHYGIIVKEMWDSHQDLKDSGEFHKAATVLKMISEVEAKRQDALQKAGMYDDGELADMVMENERKTEAISTFLTELIEEHPNLRGKVVEALRKIENPDYIAPVDYEVVKDG